MEYSQPWVYANHEAVYNPASSANVSSYFVRPNKVVKPNTGSRNNSPRALTRRKTTTSATMSSRTQPLVDHLHAQAQWPAATINRSRPVSWHPHSVDMGSISSSNIDTSAHGHDFIPYNFSTTHVNGLITPVSYPINNAPQIQELITPLDEYPMDASLYAFNTQPNHQSYMNHDQQKLEPYPMSIFYRQPEPYQPSWQLNQPQQHALPLQTAPSSPDCLPQQVDHLSLKTAELNAKDDSEELVGMGLYDSPADVQSTSLLFGGPSPTDRRALKLEESFEPVECEDEDADDCVEEEELEEDDAEFEIPVEPAYSSQSIAHHMGFQIPQQPDALASEYLATLGQLNSVYYPTSHTGYGWI